MLPGVSHRAATAKFDGNGQAHSAIERRANFLPADVELRDHLLWPFHDRATVATAAMRQRSEKSIEHRRQLRFDIGDFDEFLV